MWRYVVKRYLELFCDEREFDQTSTAPHQRHVVIFMAPWGIPAQLFYNRETTGDDAVPRVEQ